MRKVLSLVLSLLLLVISCGCTVEKAVAEEPSAPAATTAEPTSEPPVKKTTLKGIDVSSYSGEIDWETVKKSGIDFAIIRLGGRGYGGEGILYSDKNAIYNIDNAKNNGIKVGAYFFSQAISEEEAKEEAENTLKTLNGRNLDLPIACDYEHIEGDVARVDAVKYEDAVNIVKTFCETIENSGYDAMVYIENGGYFSEYDFEGYKIWYADYGKAYESPFYMLQYSKEGQVAGIDGSVDLDIMYIEEKI